jgi:hypothetical protein
MKNAFIVLIALLALPLLSFGQEEFEESLSELIEQLEEKKVFLQDLEGELESAKIEGDGFQQTLLEAEVEGVTDWIRQNTESLEKLSQIIESQDLEQEQKESSFDSQIQRHHQNNHLLDLELDSQRMEIELQLHEEEGDEETVDRLEERLDRLNERIEKTKEIHAKWEQVEAARQAEEYDKAEELEYALWVQESELDLKLQLGESKSKVSENQWFADDLKRELERVKKILSLSTEKQKQAELRLAEWEKLKERLKNSDGEERDELIEEYEHSEEKFHLQNEITNLRKELVLAESDEDEEAVEELNEFIENLKQEIQEFDNSSD